MTHNNFQPTNYEAQMDSYYQERLRQARLAFNVFLGVTVTSTIVGFGLIFVGNVPVGGATAGGGIASGTVSVYCFKLMKDTNDRLDRIACKKYRDV